VLTLKHLLKITFISFGILLLSGCAGTASYTEDAYTEVGEAFAELILKHQFGETVEDSKVPTEEKLDVETFESMELSSSQDVDDFSVAFVEMVRQNIIKEKTESEIYPFIEATDNMEFLTVYLDIKNNSIQAKPIEEWVKASNVKLIVNENYLYTPVQTLLDWDLTSINKELGQDEQLEGYLAFQVPTGVLTKKENVKLLLTNENNVQVMNLK
jgi:hypothetical protein